jgi:hypothetical protein
LGAALQADGENEVGVNGLKHQKEKRSMEHFAGLDVSVKETSVCFMRLRSPWSTGRNDVPCGTMDEVSSHVRLDLLFV